MRSQIRRILLFFTTFILVIDTLAFIALWNDFSRAGSMPGIVGFWIVPLLFIVSLQLYGRSYLADNKPGFFAGFYVFSGIFLAFYIPKLFYASFVLLELVLKLTVYPLWLLLGDPGAFGPFMTEGPLNFISMIVLPIAFLTFTVIISGIIFGRFNFRVRHHEIQSDKLPLQFDGFRLVHISDLHLGSLYGHQDKIAKAIELINRESPDLILFTGDLVNNLAEEADGWTELLSGMKSGYGNYSILGNHDYGEYYNWPNEESRQKNLDNLLKAHEESGFSVLLNRSTRISKNGHEIHLAGVENWGLPPFKQYGDLGKALKDIPEKAFTILLSHDPSHWDAEVIENKNVHLTLSGHTHGMQFGIRTKRIRWSPVQIKYPRWVGMYQQGYQYLHVSPGLGYIGYAGRIWIPPEISVITLRSTAN